MTGIIILAAGSSSRLGKPKQNLLYQGKTLLQHALTAATESRCKPIILVLGANSETIFNPVDDTIISTIRNPDWEQGMSTSIRAGVTELQKHTGIDSTIIMLCDQPFVDAGLINQLITKHQESRKGIAACAYNHTLGVPVLFGRQYFDALLLLKGQEGARKLLAVYTDDIGEVPFPKGAVDIDTMEDYEGLVGG